MSKVRSFYRKYLHNFIGVSWAGAMLINLIIESMASQSPLGGFVFLFTKPLVFLINTAIIFGTLSIALLFRHRAFVFVVISSVWLALGLVNGIILSKRMTPFTTYDLMEVKDAMSLVSNYFTKSQIFGIFVGIGLLVLFVVILFKKAPKIQEKLNYKRIIATVVIIIVASGGALTLGVKAQVLETFFPNLAYGYRDNGFAYCFLATWLDKGVRKPVDYTAESIKNIFTKDELAAMAKEKANKGDDGKKHPNIVFLQLESFMDPQTVKNIELDKDAIPNFRRLMGEYSSGRIEVPSVGAGTANTEFEAMTGMSVKFFGPGEYPYKSVLHDKTSESIPFNLKDIGYSTHALHNHRGAFYGRNLVFKNLGFDSFTSLEYMNDVGKTQKNWAKDYLLTNEIFEALKSTTTKDYIYAISVQGHGRYPGEEVIENPVIRVTKAPTMELKWNWEYYANQIYEMDKFLGELVEKLKKFDEDVILVMYGDHLPAIQNLTEDNLVGGRSTYQTDYIIWDNFGMKKKDMNLYAYQIGAEVLKRIDINRGTFVKYHQNHQGDEKYRENLQALQYDNLYGKNLLTDGLNPFKPTNMKMGIRDIRVHEVVKVGEKLYIKGKNFTPYSKVNLDGKILDTVYLGPTVLGLREEVKPEDAKKMKVSQVEKDKEILSTSE